MHSHKVYWQFHYPHPFGGPRLISFPKAFQTLYCTTQDNSSDSSGLERFRGAISSLSLFSFLKTRVMETFLNRYWMFVIAKISLKIYYDVSNILWWKHQRKAFFFNCVSCISVSILFLLIPWNKFLEERLCEYRKVWGPLMHLHYVHSTMTVQSHTNSEWTICSLWQIVINSPFGSPPKQTFPTHF